METEETWKDIQGYEQKYQISDLGNVRSLNYNNTHKPKELKQKLNHCGYYEVKLSKNNKTKDFLVHKLVAEHFIPKTKKYDAVTHIDNDKTNNNVNNLKWIYKEEICLFQHKDYENNYKISYKGKAYKKYSDLAKNERVKDGKLLLKRLDRGWTLQEALEIPKDREHFILNVTLYKYNNELYTVKQLAEISGLDSKTIYKRLARKWSIEESVEIPTGKRGENK